MIKRSKWNVEDSDTAMTESRNWSYKFRDEISTEVAEVLDSIPEDMES